MEELRSTEILDKEIQNDARKNAEKILLKAESDAKKLLSSVQDRISKEMAAKKAKYQLKLDSFQKNKDSELPLEKDRYLVSFIQTAMEKSADEYFSSLTSEERLLLVLKPLSKYESNLKSKKVFVYIYGFDMNLVKKYIGSRLNVISYEQTEFNKFVIENESGLSIKEGVIVESEDKFIRIRMTTSELICLIFEKYRHELYQALFGGRLS